MTNDDTSSEAARELTIPNYANWRVPDAQQDCTQKGLVLQVRNPPSPDVGVKKAIIERNAPESPPGTPVVTGDIISVVIFPLESRQR